MKFLDELFAPPKPYHRGRVARILTPLSSYQKARGVARRDPEEIFKIGAANIKNFKHLSEACNYIARNGKLELQDQDGNRLSSKDEYQTMLESWKDKQNIPEENERYAHARRIILSMPAGTDHKGFKKACDQWAKDCLENYDYLIAYHFEGEDDRSGQPHCHILVRTVGKDGKRLHISNEERDLMREHFAKCLNKEGIRATATRRWSRIKTEKSVSQEEYHAQKKREKTDKERARDHAIARKKKQLAARKSKKIDQTVKLVNRAIHELSESDYLDDHKLASSLTKFYRDEGSEQKISKNTQFKER